MYFRLNPRIPGTVYRSVFTFSFYPVTHFLEHGNFWNPNISQASVATCERCDDSIWVSPRKHVVGGARIPHIGRGTFGGYMYLGIPRLARDQDPSDAASGAGRVKN